MNLNLLSVDQLSESLNVPKSWIYARTREKGPAAMPTIRCGKYVRFELDKVLDWLKAKEKAA
jgi:excisionase family DNA binding protein